MAGDASRPRAFLARAHLLAGRRTLSRRVVFEPSDWKHVIGPTRWLNGRFYLFCWLRVLSAKHRYPRPSRTLRLLKRFLIYVAQPR
jgi:hypothetical protein